MASIISQNIHKKLSLKQQDHRIDKYVQDFMIAGNDFSEKGLGRLELKIRDELKIGGSTANSKRHSHHKHKLTTAQKAGLAVMGGSQRGSA